MSIQFNEAVIQAMVELEGYEFEEAKLTYAKRQKLPDTAFCGPNRTYPAHDAAHVRNALARLSQFGGRLKPAVRKSILACLKSRAKRYNVEISETVEGRLCIAKFDESVPQEVRNKMLQDIKEITEWYSNRSKKGKEE